MVLRYPGFLIDSLHSLSIKTAESSVEVLAILAGTCLFFCMSLHCVRQRLVYRACRHAHVGSGGHLVGDVEMLTMAAA